ncbi:MAG: type II secretion system F family protein [Mycobacterium leprae]
MNYHYKGRDASGRPVEGTLAAADRATALAQLQQNGILVSSLRGGGRELKVGLNTQIKFGRNNRVTPGELAAFCSQFSTMIAAGVPLLQTLELLAKQFQPRRLSVVLTDVLRSVQSGSSLSQGMAAHRKDLPGVLIYITSVAEVTGNLDQGYALMAKQFEQEEDLGRKIRSAMTYPTVVLVVAAAVIIFMLTYVLPNYAAMFSSLNAKLPTSTRMLMAFGAFVTHQWYLLVPVPFLLVWGWRQAMRRRAVRTRYQYLLLKLPLFRDIVYKREFGWLTRTLGTMVRSGVPLLSALASVQEAMDFAPMARAVAKVQESVSGGESFGAALKRQRLFDPISVEMIALGEVSGSLESMLFRVADISEKELATLLDRATSLMEPAMTLVLGVIVVSIIIPMLLPMFDIFKEIH